MDDKLMPQRRLDGAKVAIGGNVEYRHFECHSFLVASGADPAEGWPMVGHQPTCGECGKVIRRLGPT